MLPFVGRKSRIGFDQLFGFELTQEFLLSWVDPAFDVFLHLADEGHIGPFPKHIYCMALALVTGYSLDVFRLSFRSLNVPNFFIFVISVPVEVQIEVVVHFASQVLGSKHLFFLFLPLWLTKRVAFVGGRFVVGVLLPLPGVVMGSVWLSLEREFLTGLALKHRVNFGIVEQFNPALGLSGDVNALVLHHFLDTVMFDTLKRPELPKLAT